MAIFSFRMKISMHFKVNNKALIHLFQQAFFKKSNFKKKFNLHNLKNPCVLTANIRFLCFIHHYLYNFGDVSILKAVLHFRLFSTFYHLKENEDSDSCYVTYFDRT